MMEANHWQNRVDLFLKENTPPNSILFLGDSLTEGFDLHHYFPSYKMVNQGISGDTLTGVKKRLETTVLPLHPKTVFLMIGVNDLGDGRTTTPIQQDYDYLFSRFNAVWEQRTECVVFSLLPCSTSWGKNMPDQIIQVNQVLKQTCRKWNVTFMDIHPLFLDAEGNANNKLFSDGLHLNTQGYTIWAKEINEYLRK